jgi:hypothetical protein
MPIKFTHLVDIYRHTVFAADGPEGTLTIPSAEVVELLKLVEVDGPVGDTAIAESGISILDDTPDLQVNSQVRIRIGHPRVGLGTFARTFDEFLDAPKARFKVPDRFFVLEGGLTRDMASPTPELDAYRRAVALVTLLAEAASYLDETKHEIIFIDDGKFAVPIRYGQSILTNLTEEKVQALLQHFSDPTHRDQKLEILAQAVLTNTRAVPRAERLEFLFANLSTLVTAVRDGYRLFASNFSYSKIRSDLEAAKLEFVTKIHKTVVDIQNQLLGIPVATVIVASQLKEAKACSVELWTDVAVVAGAWIFWILLFIAIVNQWLTLGVIGGEIGRQKDKMRKDYAEIAGEFSDIFRSLGRRIWWHRFGLFLILAIATGGATFASYAFRYLVQANFSSCLWIVISAPPTP